jgi:hypothetical protein
MLANEPVREDWRESQEAFEFAEALKHIEARLQEILGKCAAVLTVEELSILRWAVGVRRD